VTYNTGIYAPDPVAWSFPFGTTRVGAPQFLLQVLDLRVDRALDFFMFMALGYVPWMMENGLRLLAAGSYLTGMPGRVVHLWEIGKPLQESPHGGNSPLELLREYITREEVHVLTPTAYDPPREFSPYVSSSTGDRRTRVLLMDTAQVKRGQMRGFVRGKSEVLIPLLTRPPAHAKAHAWTLLAGGWLRGAEAPAVVNLWSLPEADALLAAIRRVSENTAYQEFARTCVGGEDQHLLGPITHYDPNPAVAPNGVLRYRE
jgi:hypothetical protein